MGYDQENAPVLPPADHRDARWSEVAAYDASAPDTPELTAYTVGLLAGSVVRSRGTGAGAVFPGVVVVVVDSDVVDEGEEGGAVVFAAGADVDVDPVDGTVVVVDKVIVADDVVVVGDDVVVVEEALVGGLVVAGGAGCRAGAGVTMMFARSTEASTSFLAGTTRPFAHDGSVGRSRAQAGSSIRLRRDP